MREHRFLLKDQQLHLVRVTYGATGQIDSLNGISIVGDPGMGVTELIANLMHICAQAIYNKPVLLINDLPKELQKQILGTLEEEEEAPEAITTEPVGHEL